MSQEIEFPVNINLESQEEKIQPQVKKLYKFFNYVSNYHNGKIDTMTTQSYLYLFVRDGAIKVDYDGEISIETTGLNISIWVNRVEKEVEINGNANGYEFNIQFLIAN